MTPKRPLAWVYAKDPGDSGSWTVYEIGYDASVAKWPKIVTVTYEDEAKTVCDAHNAQFPMPEAP